MPGYEYKKCGVILSNFVRCVCGNSNFLSKKKDVRMKQNLRVASAVDSINNKFKQES